MMNKGGGGDGGGGGLRLRVFAGERLSEFELPLKCVDTVGELRDLLRTSPDYLGGASRRFSFVTSGLEAAADDAPLSSFDLAEGVDVEAFPPSALHDAEQQKRQKHQQHLQYQYYRRQRQQEALEVIAAGSGGAGGGKLHPDYEPAPAGQHDDFGGATEQRRHSTPDGDPDGQGTEEDADEHDTAGGEGEKEGKKKRKSGRRVLGIFRRNSDMGPRSWARGWSSSSSSSSSSASATASTQPSKHG